MVSKNATLKKGDNVLVVNQTEPRSRWTLGKIINTYPDSNGLVRTVLVKLGKTLFKRPIK